jgi:AraC-like DNA-binding protein
MAGMEPQLRYESLYRGAVVSITDVRCRPFNCGCGCEEWSSAHSIVFPRTGVFVKYQSTGSVVADCNHVLFFNTDESYRVSHPVPGGDDCTSFTFATDVLHDALTPYDLRVRDRRKALFPITHGPIEPRVLFLQHRLRQFLRSSGQDAVAVEELALDLLHDSLESAFAAQGKRPLRARAPAPRSRLERAESAKSFLAAHFRSPLTLARIARAVYSSPYHFARLFRREVGIPVHQYLNRLRLGAALERLSDGEPNLTQLALDLGYSSHSHFSDAFRRSFSTPPSAVRKTLTADRLRELSKNLKA